VIDTDKVGTAIHQGGSSQKSRWSAGDGTPLAHQRAHPHALRSHGNVCGRWHEVASVDPGDEQVWEALRALYLIGLPMTSPAIRPYQRELPEISGRIRQQALLTEKAIPRPRATLVHSACDSAERRSFTHVSLCPEASVCASLSTSQ